MGFKPQYATTTSCIWIINNFHDKYFNTLSILEILLFFFTILFYIQVSQFIYGCVLDGCDDYGCEGSCENLENGEFLCQCGEGEVLDIDGKSCKGMLQPYCTVISMSYIINRNETPQNRARNKTLLGCFFKMAVF